MNRREFLTTAAATPLLTDWGPFGWGPLGSTPDEESIEYDGLAPDLEDFPDHLTDIRFDESELRDYQPRLVTDQETRQEMTEMYGWSCDSVEFDVTAHYFWTRYSTQRSSLEHWVGIDFGDDEHFLDHEPYIAFVRPDGTLDQIVCTGGHHMALELDPLTANVSEHRVPGVRTHAVLKVVRPHHHYVEAPPSEDGGFIDAYAHFGSWLQIYATWYKNGRYDKTADQAVLDPYSFYDDGEQDYRIHWWRSGTWDAFAARHIRLRSLSERDTVRAEE